MNTLLIKKFRKNNPEYKTPLTKEEEEKMLAAHLKKMLKEEKLLTLQ